MTTIEHSPLACTVCRKSFRHTEEVVTISARVFDKDNFTFSALTNPIHISEFNFSEVRELSPRESNFHLKCFEEVAGKDFLP